jgi:hypothetical protein
MTLKEKYAGAYADVYYIDESPEDAKTVYFSFGEVTCNDYGDPICDEFGVFDHEIFYYVDDDEWDILKRGQNTGGDFCIISDTVEYNHIS